MVFVILQKEGDKLLFRLPIQRRKPELLVQHRSPAHEKSGDGDISPLGMPGEDIKTRLMNLFDILAFAGDAGDRFEKIPVFHSLFEFHRFAGIHHLLFEQFTDPGGIAVEKRNRLLGITAVLRRVNLILAHAGALPHMVVETDLVGHLIASAERVQVLKQLLGIPGGRGIGKGSEVSCLAVLLHIPGNRKARPLFIGQLYIGIGAVIHELDVVSRPVLFDQVDLEHQGFRLGPRHDEIEVLNLTDHLCGLEVMDSGKILIHPVVKILCLADIDDLAGLVLHLIASGFFRQICQFCLDIFSVHQRFNTTTVAPVPPSEGMPR